MLVLKVGFVRVHDFVVFVGLGFFEFFKIMYCVRSVLFCGSRCHVKDCLWLRLVHLTDIVHVSLLNKRQSAMIMSKVPNIAEKITL